MHDKTYDVIVIGGGMAGAHASWPLVKAGKKVLMLDGGVRPEPSRYHDSDGDFESLRTESEEQHRLFLGDELGAVLDASGKSHSSAMTSGNRSYVSEQTQAHLRLDLEDIHIIQSLAKGGLSEAWGAVCGTFNPRELEHAGMPADRMHAHYQAVMDRVGISGSEPGYTTQPPAQITSSMRQILARYQKLSSGKRGEFELRPALLALLTEPFRNRLPTKYQDLDFYMVKESAIYRARYTIEELEQHPNFEYQPGVVVREVRENGKHLEVVGTDFTGAHALWDGARVILAAGAINSNRIMLKSDASFVPTDLMLKPDYTLECFDPRLLGKPGERARYSLCQLMLDLPGENGESALYANFYNYRSLMLWRLLQYAPLPTPETLALLARLSSALVLVDVRFPGSEGPCEMTLAGDALVIRQKPQGTAYKKRLPELKSFLRTLGLIPVRTSPLPLGASVHYAGGIATSLTGEVEKHPGLYVADSSGWKALPAKPTALTIMANADRIGTEVLKSL